MKKIKYIFLTTLILSILLSVSASAIDLPEPTEEFFVNDFADVIDDEVEEELQAIGVSLYNQTTAQVVVVTVESLDGYDVDEYTLELGREWGVGSSETDNGVVLLMSVNDRQVAIQVGYGLEGCLPDGKTGRILDNYAIPYLSNNDFSMGLSEAYKALVAVVCEEYDVELSGDYNLNSYETTEEDFDMGSIIAIAFLIIITISVLDLVLNKFRGGSGRGGGSHHGGGYYGGHTYYGGSSHSGGFHSGGSSFRGGGGGFRGGGGSFGGGGSSRGF